MNTTSIIQHLLKSAPGSLENHTPSSVPRPRPLRSGTGQNNSLGDRTKGILGGMVLAALLAFIGQRLWAKRTRFRLREWNRAVSLRHERSYFDAVGDAAERHQGILEGRDRIDHARWRGADRHPNWVFQCLSVRWQRGARGGSTKPSTCSAG
jgi:hypothetical protein